MSAAVASAAPPRSSSRAGGRPYPMERMPSTMSDTSTPVATNSVLNQKAGPGASLYQNCRLVLDGLERVPGFAEAFMTGVAGSEDAAIVSSDPVSRSLHTLRLGSSLCFLFNALGLDHELEVNPAATMANFKACQKSTAHFIMACKRHLNWSDQDLFAIHELYGQDTNGVVKVINTAKKLLDLLESQGVLNPPAEPTVEVQASGPKDERAMIVREILDSERKYVQDLEVLQDYQRQLAENDILTQDQIHNMFLNLNALADFQRRFLIGVEANTSQAPENQRFGHLFLQMEDHFSVYEPYCANLTSAQNLAQAENAALSRLSHVLEPVYELPHLIIKPVQRLCKYPLLMKELVKHTNPDTPFYAELEEGHAAIMRVTDKVNETKRKEDNRQAVSELNRRVEDWKGHDPASFGELMLQETFNVIKNDSDREYNVYLFEKIILCCKESGATSKKNSKSNSILKKPASRKSAMLQLKGRIFVNNVTAATPIVKNGQFLLEVRWKGDPGEEAFSIKCRTEELLKQWQKAILKAVDETPARRRTQHLSNQSRHRGYTSPLSTFPATPMSEAGPSNASVYSYQSETSSPYPHSNHAPFFQGQAGFDDEGDGNTNDDAGSGRSTPSIARQGSSRSYVPAERDSVGADGRPRGPAHETLIHQWRAQTPTHQAPPMPSLARGQSSVAPESADYYSANGSSHSLRSSASSRGLRTKQSSEWGSAPPPRAMPGDGPAGHRPRGTAPTYGSFHEEDGTPRMAVDGTPRPNGVHRQGAMPGHPPPSLAQRNRSASSPHMYQASPPMSRSGSQEQWGPMPSHRQPGEPSTVSPLKVGRDGIPSGSSSASQSGPKRFSSSSNGTDRSSDRSSQSQGQTYTAATSPATTLPGMPPSSRTASHMRNGSVPTTQMKVRVNYGSDSFLLSVPPDVPYRELVDKVMKKIRLCGDRTIAEMSALRLRYTDEDGDRILMNSQEDLAMAFADLTRGLTDSLTLYAA